MIEPKNGRKQPARTLEKNQLLCTVIHEELDKQQVLRPDPPCVVSFIVSKQCAGRGRLKLLGKLVDMTLAEADRKKTKF